jgi:hypothetical protein
MHRSLGLFAFCAARLFLVVSMVYDFQSPRA